MKGRTEEESREYVRGLEEVVEVCDRLLVIYGNRFDYERGVRAGIGQVKECTMNAIRKEKKDHKEWYEEGE